jgi:hypothetical protein
LHISQDIVLDAPLGSQGEVKQRLFSLLLEGALRQFQVERPGLALGQDALGFSSGAPPDADACVLGIQTWLIADTPPGVQKRTRRAQRPSEVAVVG